ncbi:glycosyltransferase family protein [Flavihumibacter profundi]|uniref:hypothetical protein n=1 Tax=Flavihumibacter profundi TaxID=2716883 RepID=UPI001CC743A9|nr:hypothetical protein [Flavihumibacter profundi]MBZ5858002.1 hypothetical protein [Flavihumibacter profundi]
MIIKAGQNLCLGYSNKGMPEKLTILHFQPLEKYPPIMNLIEYLSGQHFNNIFILSRANNKAGKFIYKNYNPIVKIKRYGGEVLDSSKFASWLGYIFFYTRAFLFLLWNRPAKVLYFETISSFPVVLYKMFINKKAKVYIHYHEYTSPPEYGSGMVLIRYFHKLERKIYHEAIWISHTNQFRLNLFKEDENILGENLKVMPNYPPQSWHKTIVKKNEAIKRVVYVGALSLTTMYTREFSEWVIKQRGKVTWDIYSDNFSAETAAYFRTLNTEWIKFKGSVNYNELPEVLRHYDIGVILYNGHIPNYIYNAPNKLFEYLVCGLDVWFPDVMVGCMEYVTLPNNRPCVAAFDFEKLDKINLCTNKNEDMISYKTYTSEEIYSKLYKELTT